MDFLSFSLLHIKTNSHTSSFASRLHTRACAHTFETKTNVSSICFVFTNPVCFCSFFYCSEHLLPLAFVQSLGLTLRIRHKQCVRRTSHFLLGLKLLSWIWQKKDSEPEITHCLSPGLVSSHSLITFSLSSHRLFALGQNYEEQLLFIESTRI